MSDPAICIGHPVSAPPPAARGSAQDPAQVRPADPGFHGAVFRNSHTPYGFRNSEFGNPESGIGKSDKLWRGATYFARTPVNIGPDEVHIFLMVRNIPP